MERAAILAALSGKTQLGDCESALLGLGLCKIGQGWESNVYSYEELDFVVKVMCKAHQKPNPSEKFCPRELEHPLVAKTETVYHDPFLIIFQEKVEVCQSSYDYYSNQEWIHFEMQLRRDGFSDIIPQNVGTTKDGKKVAIDWTFDLPSC